MKNTKRGIVAPLVVVLVAVLIIGGLVFYSRYQSQSQQDQSSYPEVNNAEQSGASPIKLLSAELPTSIPEQRSYADIFDCQPKDFDPNQRILNENMTRQDTVDLGGGYSLTPYQFGCASSQDFVLEVTKNGARHTLYTHISTWSLSANKEFLFLNNAIKNQKGTYDFQTRIINVKTKQAVSLPNIACASTRGFWNGQNLVTYSDYNTVEYGTTEMSDYITNICQWNTEGKVLNQLEAKLYWGAASAAYLNDKIGFLPKNSNIFYAYSNTVAPEKVSDNTYMCYLYLQDVTNQNNHKKIRITEGERGYCPEIEFDFDAFKYDATTINFKLVDQNSKNN
ncbi:MAG: hypothetical protein V4519_00030 [Patescibacteria group bacterium]